MKLIIGVYDRELSHNLAIVLSGKKIAPIEAESMEEIPALLERHPGAMLLCEETSLNFFQKIKARVSYVDIYLLFHPNLSATDLLALKDFGIKALIPYSEDPAKIIEIIIKQLSMFAASMKQQDQSLIVPDHKEHRDTAIHLPYSKKWAYGELQGFNSSKLAVAINDENVRHALTEARESDNLMMYLRGLNVRMYADLIYSQKNIFVFRYRKMSKSDAYRLAYFIHYCQQQKNSDKIAINI